MPGNREAYDNAMNAGHNAAWDKEWQMAAAAYGQAVQEFPNDHEAHIHLGLALLEVGRLEDALRVYTRANQLNPEDAIPLEKSADILERLGRLQDAAQQYVNVADVYIAQRDPDKAIHNWQQATRLTPGLVRVHAKLAQAHERLGEKNKAIREYLILGQNLQRMREKDNALKAIQRALRLDPKNVPSLNALQALEAGSDIVVPASDKERTAGGASANLASRAATPLIEADPLGPMGESMTDALGVLAMFVMEGGALDASGAAALQALEFQRQGIFDQAIEAYGRAASTLNHPALKMSLGGLLVLSERYDEAVKHLGEAVMHPQLAPGAYHALGQSYYHLGKQKQAINYLFQAAQAVDTSNMEPGEDDIKIASVYEELLDLVQSRPQETLSQISARYMQLLTGKEWKMRIGETRRQLEDTLRTQGEQSVVDILTANRSDELTEAVSRIDRYIRQNLFTLAMDEAHRAVEFSAFYLPVHVRMAEIMMREGRVRQAINKYNVIAKTYLVRGENDRAASILSEVLEMAPLDISVRESLIELLETEERWDEALDQYVDLADTHHQLGNFDMSRDVYTGAERLASRVNASVDKVVRIKHRVADIDQMRLDTRRAQKTYEDIIQIAVDDERAHRMLVELHFRQNNAVEAIKRLDTLLGIYAKNRQINPMTQLLEELVTTYPNDTGLRSRLGAIYTKLKRKEDAIRQYDALGELQLEAGLHQDAINTIKQIIALNPDGIQEYRRLLVQLGG
jgi:tetratricopeptide (TPR) repeat protein